MAEYTNINKIIDNQTEIITYEFSENMTVEDCTKQLLDVFQEEIDAIKDDITNKENKIRVNIKKSRFDVKLEAFRIALNDDNLITCDLVCHGVPSPQVWYDYCNYIIYMPLKKI